MLYPAIEVGKLIVVGGRANRPLGVAAASGRAEMDTQKECNIADLDLV
jgi:hypothetical protein